MGSSSSLALVWLRNSLRVADNEALLAASRSSATNVLVYYALDPSRLRPRAAAGAGLELVQQLPSLGPHQCACAGPAAALMCYWCTLQLSGRCLVIGAERDLLLVQHLTVRCSTERRLCEPQAQV